MIRRSLIALAALGLGEAPAHHAMGGALPVGVAA